MRLIAGSIIHLYALGQRIVVLNSVEDVVELFENRARIYSDRPVFPVRDMCVTESAFIFCHICFLALIPLICLGLVGDITLVCLTTATSGELTGRYANKTSKQMRSTSTVPSKRVKFMRCSWRFLIPQTRLWITLNCMFLQ